MTRRPKASAALLVLLAVLGATSSYATAEQATQPQTTRAGQIDAGKYHSCAAQAAATLRCWGYGGDGALGYGSTASIGDDEVPAAAGPVDLGTASAVRAVAAGAVHTCALLADGSVRCFGFAGDGRLGYAGTGVRRARRPRRRPYSDRDHRRARAYVRDPRRWHRALLGLRPGRAAGLRHR